MTTITSFIKRRPVLTYFTLAFAISWSAVLMASGGIPVSEDQLEMLGVATLLGPTGAAILLTSLFSGRAGFRDLRSRLFRWRVSARWYAVALLTAPLSIGAVLLALSLFSSEFQPRILNSDAKLTLIFSGIAAGLMVGFFEELGWTGFAVPRLRARYSMLMTGGIIVGLLWGAWHTLLFWESDSFSGAFPLAFLLARLFSCLPPYRVLMVWVYDRTESLFVAMLMHMSFVASLVIIEPALEDRDLFTYILARAVVWCVITALAIANFRAPSYNTSLSLKETTL